MEQNIDKIKTGSSALGNRTPTREQPERLHERRTSGDEKIENRTKANATVGVRPSPIRDRNDERSMLT